MQNITDIKLIRSDIETIQSGKTISIDDGSSLINISIGDTELNKIMTATAESITGYCKAYQGNIIDKINYLIKEGHINKNELEEYYSRYKLSIELENTGTKLLSYEEWIESVSYEEELADVFYGSFDSYSIRSYKEMGPDILDSKIISYITIAGQGPNIYLIINQESQTVKLKGYSLLHEITIILDIDHEDAIEMFNID